MNLNSDDAIYCIALNGISRVGPVIARNLVSYCGSPQAVFKESKRKLLRIPGVGERIATYLGDRGILAAAENERELLLKYNIDAHFYLEPTYPERLKQIVQAPVVLYSRGQT